MSSQPIAAKPASSPATASSAVTSKPLILLGLAVIIAVTLLAYVPAMRGGFVWNDNSYVYQNPLLSEPSFSNLVKIWSLRPVTRADGQEYYAGYTEQYYPLVFSSYWLESHIWGNSKATGFHVVNVLLHIGNALLVWLILARLKFPWAYLVALIFALHPVEVESVAWITERKNVLSGAFYLLAMLSYLRFDRQGRRGFYFAALVCFVLALLSKTVVCTWPIILLLILWSQKERLAGRDFLRLIPFFAVGAALGGLTAYLERHSVGAVGSEWQIAFWQRCIIAGKAVFFYIWKLLWPMNLSFIYPRWEPAEFTPIGLLWPMGVVAVTLALWYWRKITGHAGLAAWSAFVITLFPALGFFDVYPFRYSFVADHFQYLASIFFIALVVGLVHRLYRRVNPLRLRLGPTPRREPFRWSAVPIIPAMLGAVVLVALAGLTYIQAASFTDSKTLWQETSRKNPQGWMAWNNLGAVYMQEQNFSAASECFEQLLTLRPNYAPAHANYARALRGQNQVDVAIEHLLRAIELEPNYVWAYLNLADIYAQGQQYEPAIATYKKTIQLAEASSLLSDRRTSRIEALSHLSAVYAETGQYALAASYAQQAINLARAYGEQALAAEIEGRLQHYRELSIK